MLPCRQRQFFDTDSCVLYGFEAKCVSVHWELTLGKWDRLGGLSGLSGSSKKDEKKQIFHQDLLNLLGMEAESERSHNK